MISRYTRPAMGRIWSEDNKYAKWLEVELAASETLAEMGEVRRRLREFVPLHASLPRRGERRSPGARYRTSYAT